MSWYDDLITSMGGSTFGDSSPLPVISSEVPSWPDIFEGVNFGDGVTTGGVPSDWNWGDILSGVTGAANSGLPSSILQLLGIGAGNEGGLLGGISGQSAGLGGVGLLGALSALNSEPKVTTGKTTSGRTGATTTETGAPEWYKQLTQNLGGAISGDNGSWSDLGDYMAGGSESVADADLSKYMNPYVESVLQPQLTRMTEDFMGQQNKRDANAAMVGAFGGSRNILDNSLAEERFDKAKSETTNNALSQAFTNAMTAFGQDRTAQQWGAGLTGNLYSALKPNTTTGVTSNIGDTQTTTSIGAEPNRLAQIANMGGSLFGLGTQAGVIPPIVP